MNLKMALLTLLKTSKCKKNGDFQYFKKKLPGIYKTNVLFSLKVGRHMLLYALDVVFVILRLEC